MFSNLHQVHQHRVVTHVLILLSKYNYVIYVLINITVFVLVFEYKALGAYAPSAGSIIPKVG